MSKANKVLSGYGSLAESMGFQVKNDKFYMLGDTEDDMIPAKRKGRHLVLPTYERITEGFGEKLHPFHPMCESVLEGQSETIKWLRDAMRYSIQLHATTLITEILTVACGKRKPRSPKFHKMMAKVTDGLTKPKFDKMLLDDWKKFVIESAKDDDIHRWVNIFLNSNQNIDGTKYLRALNFSTIFDDEGGDLSSDIFGIKMGRKANKQIILNLLSHVMGFIPESVGSNDDRPWFGCILRAYCAYVMSHNKVLRTFKEIHPVTTLTEEWFDMIENMKEYGNAIQALELNTGDEREVRSVAKEPAPTLPKADAPNPHHKPYTATELEQPVESQGRSILDVNGASATGLTQHQATQWMSPAKQRELERQGNNGNMFSNQPQSYFDEPTQPSMFGGNQNNSSLFGGNQQQSTPGMFDNPNSGGSMFGGGQGDMPTFGGQRSGSHFG